MKKATEKLYDVQGCPRLPELPLQQRFARFRLKRDPFQATHDTNNDGEKGKKKLPIIEI
jgi:hypothetical protein